MDVNDSAPATMPSRPGLRYRRVTPDFVQRTTDARKVLVLQWGALGDVVHSLPALWSIRQAYPKAQIDVLTSGSGAALLELLPWIDGRLLQASRKSGLTRKELALIFALRRTGYDVSINLPGTNHGCVLAWAAGVRRRIGRRPYWDGKAGWRLLQHEVMDFRYDHDPMYRQWLGCLAQAGFAGDSGFHIELPPRALQGTGIGEQDRGGYIHVSPNTTDDARQLSVPQTVDLLEGLHRQLPQYRLVLSGLGNERERSRMEAVLAGLSFKPWQVFTGTLDVVQLSAVIRGAALHLSGDTGPLHLAWMTQTPSVSWFLTKHDNHEYMPPPPHRALLGQRGADGVLAGISTQALLDAALDLMAAKDRLAQ